MKKLLLILLSAFYAGCSGTVIKPAGASAGPALHERGMEGGDGVTGTGGGVSEPVAPKAN